MRMRFFRSHFSSLRESFFPKSKPKSVTRSRSLAVEALEERVVMSASPADYGAWRDMAIGLGDISAVDIVGTDSQQALGSPTTLDADTHQLIGLDRVAAQYPAYTGTGYSIAVIDTGVDYNHPNLAGRVIAGYDFINRDSNAIDDNGHGTHVAGIIASNHPTYRGIVPNANIIALKVLASNGTGNFGAVEDALRWVVNNQATYNIVAVNMSLGAGNYTSSPFSFLEDEFTALRSQGVFIASAAGNSFYTYSSQMGLGYPAISPQAVAVGAVWDASVGSVTWSSGARDFSTAADRITSFTQRSSLLDILAPGAFVTNTASGGGFATMAGTSMAAPVVAGAAALIHQALDSMGQGGLANQDYILSLMRSTGVNVVDGDDENDNVTNTGLIFQRLDLYAALRQIVGTTNAPPTLAAIPNVTMSHRTDSIQVALSATDGNGDPLTFSAQAVRADAVNSLAYSLDQHYGFYASPGGEHLNLRGLNEKYFLGSGSSWHYILATGQVYRWQGSIAASPLIGNLNAEYYNNLALLVSAEPYLVGDSNVVVNLTGSTITINPNSGYVGNIQVRASVTDGSSTDSRVFTISVVNQTPSLAAISDKTMSYNQNTIAVALSATDADGDSITYSTSVQEVNPTALLAYQLDQQYGFYAAPSEYVNLRGASEKYFLGNGGVWYFVLPTGAIYRFVGSIAASTYIATLDSTFYADTQNIVNAPAFGLMASSQFTSSIVGSTLTLDPAASFRGTAQITVTASDGHASSTRTFQLAVTNSAPVLTSLSDQTMSHNQANVIVPLSATDADGDAVTITVAASASNPTATLAYQLDQQLGFRAASSEYLNMRGSQEKYFLGNGSNWYFILSTGAVYRWGTSVASSTLVGTLNSSYYANLNLLTNATSTGGSTNIPVSWAGGNLMVDPPSNFVGDVSVNVSASDGVNTSTRNFVVHVTNSAPVIASIADRTMPRTQSNTVINLSATDADSDTVTWSLQATTSNPSAQLAYQLDQQLGFNAAPSEYLNMRGAQEKYFLGNGSWYFILPTGAVYRWTTTLASSQYLGILSPAYYSDLSRVVSAPSPDTANLSASVTLSGSQVTVDPGVDFIGTVQVTVTASDGASSSQRTFQVTVTA